MCYLELFLWTPPLCFIGFRQGFSVNRLLDDKVAIVTGSSRGLGLAISQTLGADGASVLVVSRTEEGMKAGLARLATSGVRAEGFVGDLTEPESPSRVVARALDCFGRLDILVNSAGIFVWKKLLDLTEKDWNQTLATNLSAPFFLLQAAARAMIEAGRGGSIINITSIHGLVGDPHVAAHCAAKFGLTGLTQSAAEALREFDIRVNAVAPGSIEPESAEKRGSSPRQKVTQGDVATLVAFLASDLSRTITGATLEAFGSTKKIIKA